MMRKATLILLVCLLATQVFAAADWSEWATTYGGTGIDYRWRFNGMCLVNGCLKDIQFRNNTSRKLIFKYVAHVEQMGNSHEEDTETGSDVVGADSAGRIIPLGRGLKVIRVRIEVQ